jgi:NAD-specific glutamate dehydrogenase
MPIWQHAGEHMQFVDPMNPASKEFKEALQQLGEVITNGQKHLDAEAKRQQKEMGAEGKGGENYGGTPASTYKQAVQAQQALTDLELDAAKKQQDLAFDAEKRKQDLAFRDAQFAQSIRHKAAELKLKKPSGGDKAA